MCIRDRYYTVLIMTVSDRDHYYKLQTSAPASFVMSHDNLLNGHDIEGEKDKPNTLSRRRNSQIESDAKEKSY